VKLDDSTFSENVFTKMQNISIS